jgi:hypothetical protein
MFEWNVDVWLEKKDDPWFLGDWSEDDDYDDDFDRCFEQGFRYDE